MAAKSTTGRRGYSEAFIGAPRIRAVDYTGQGSRAVDEFLAWYRKEHIMPNIKVTADGIVFINNQRSDLTVSLTKGGTTNGNRRLVRLLPAGKTEVLAKVPGRVWADQDTLHALIAEHVR